MSMKEKSIWSNKRYIMSFLEGFFLLALSLVANNFAGKFANKAASNPVTDILLNNIPVFNVSHIFIEGTIIFLVLVAVLTFAHPRRIPFTFKMMALFILIRSLSVSLTHIAPPVDRTVINTNDVFQKVFFDSELFFSGHTGLPFLFALAYQQNRWLMSSFLAATVIGAISVILGHLHYSIDIFGAFFITYAIYHMATSFFKDDYNLFLKTLSGNKPKNSA